jgi:hypothetical protein
MPSLGEVEHSALAGRGGPTPGTWTGLAGMADVWRDWLSAWDGLSVEGEEYRELDGERVLVLTLYTGRDHDDCRHLQHSRPHDLHDLCPGDLGHLADRVVSGSSCG